MLTILFLALCSVSFAAELTPAEPHTRRALIESGCTFENNAEMAAADGNLLRYVQYYQEIPVVGIHSVDHVDSTGEIIASTGLILSKIEEDIPTVDVPMVDVNNLVLGYNCEENEDQLVIMFIDGRATLVRKVDCWTAFDEAANQIHRYRMKFDAQTGELLKSFDAIDHHTLKKQRRRYLGLEQFEAHGGNTRTGMYTHTLKVLRDGETCTYSTDHVDTVHNQFSTSRNIDTPFSFPCSDLPEQTDAINGGFSPLNDGAAFGEAVFDMYTEWYDMEPLPFKLQMRVHYGDNWENAMWDGRAMYYGDGATSFHPLVSLGVTAHEVSHGVTQYAGNMDYENQSGGLNEAFSDMAGAVAEYFYFGETEYEMGSRIAKGDGSMRYMCNPPADSRSIGHVDDYEEGMDVHFSSGVFNKAFCKLSKMEAWNPRKSFHLFLTANKMHWEEETDFQEGADLTMLAVRELGYEEDDVCTAFAEVGLIADGCPGFVSPAPTNQPTAAPFPYCETTHFVILRTQTWAVEVSWDIEGLDCSSDGQEYADSTVYSKRCCIPDGEYVLTCTDSYDDGWHGASIEIDGQVYCDDFSSGSAQTELVTIVNGVVNTNPPTTLPTVAPSIRMPTSAPATREPSSTPTTSIPSASPPTCETPFDVVLRTLVWSVEITWEIEGLECTSAGVTYADNNVYTQSCCIPDGDYVLVCGDSYGDGWHGASLEIDGQVYCDDFSTGYAQTESVTVSTGGTNPPTTTPTTTSPTSLPTSASSTSPSSAPTTLPTASPSTDEPTASPTSDPASCTSYTFTMNTRTWGNEVSWNLEGVAGCDSSEYVPYGDYNSYTTDCCVPDGEFTLNCEDVWGDGWHYGSLNIDGNDYCGDFLNGSLQTESIVFGDSGACEDSAPAQLCMAIKMEGYCDNTFGMCESTCEQCTVV